METQANYRTLPRICSRNSLGRQLEVSNLINECIALEPAQRNLLDELEPQILEVFARRATEPIRQVLTATEMRDAEQRLPSARVSASVESYE